MREVNLPVTISKLVMMSALVSITSCAYTDDNEMAPVSLPEVNDNLFFIGQDLGAIRDYIGAECCIEPDGTTAYVNLYGVLDPKQGYGGLGIDETGAPIDLEHSWGSGPVSAWKSATEFDAPHLAIGLSMTNADEPGGVAGIASGRYDPQIRQLARLFDHIEGTGFLRIGYEFDGAWNSGYENHEDFIGAWRRIVDVLREEGVDNVAYVWQGSASPIDDAIDQAHENIALWYPGDDYVDWVGVSLFVDPDEEQPLDMPYRSPAARILLDELVDFARQHSKPVMIAEAAPQSYDIDTLTRANTTPLWDGPPAQNVEQLNAETVWNDWYAPLFEYMDENSDAIRALAYINADWDNQPMWGPPHDGGYWGDTRVTVNPDIARRWNEALSDWLSEQAE